MRTAGAALANGVASHILELATVVASADLAERLVLGVKREVKRIVRLRTADGEPLTIDFPAHAVVAKNTLHLDKARASRIIAPVRSR